MKFNLIFLKRAECWDPLDLFWRWTNGQWEVLDGFGTEKYHSAGWMDPSGNILAFGGTLDEDCSCSLNSVNKMNETDAVFTLQRLSE